MGSWITFTTQNAWVLAPIVVLLASVAFSAANLSKVWDEWLCHLIAAEIGVFSVLGIAAAIAKGTKEPRVVGVVLIVFAIASIMGMLMARLLDLADHGLASVLSLVFKWVQTPFFTTIGLLSSIVVGIVSNVSLRRGCVFLEIGGKSQGALTLGGVVWAKGGCFESDGRVKDDMAKHEVYHSRQATAFGETGFYLAYLLLGMPWGALQGGAPMSTNASGCGNPFEKTARTYNHSTKPKAAHEC